MVIGLKANTWQFMASSTRILPSSFTRWIAKSSRHPSPWLIQAPGILFESAGIASKQMLGEGAFGTVYRGYDGDLKRPVAIKVPHRHMVDKPEDIDLYLEEAQVVASLDHANIVPVHDVGRTEDGLCYVVSKFIEGSDLARRTGKSRYRTASQRGW